MSMLEKANRFFDIKGILFLLIFLFIVFPIAGIALLWPYYTYLGVHLNISSITPLILPGWILAVMGLFFIVTFFASPVLVGYIVKKTVEYSPVHDNNHGNEIIHGFTISRRLLLAGVISFALVLFGSAAVNDFPSISLFKIFWAIPCTIYLLGFFPTEEEKYSTWKTIVWAMAITTLTMFWESLIVSKNAPTATVFNMIAIWFTLAYLSSFAFFDIKQNLRSLSKKYVLVCIIIFIGMFCTSAVNNPVLAENSGKLALAMLQNKEHKEVLTFLNHDPCNMLQELCSDKNFKAHEKGCILEDVFLVNDLGDTRHVLVKSKFPTTGGEYLLLTIGKNKTPIHFERKSLEELKAISIAGWEKRKNRMKSVTFLR